jgi:uncharacterized membrane protein
MPQRLISFFLAVIGIIGVVASLAGVPSLWLRAMLTVFFLLFLVAAGILLLTSEFNLLHAVSTLRACRWSGRCDMS